MSILIYFVALFAFTKKRISVYGLFIGLQVVSLSAAVIINNYEGVNSLLRGFNLLYTILIITIMFSPWKKYTKIIKVQSVDFLRLKKISIIIAVISTITFMIYAIAAYIIVNSVHDINAYKYTEGVRGSILASIIPFNLKWLTLANILLPFSSFMVPLHFYYLSIKKNSMAVICIILSSNIILYGLTIFSRWTTVHYIMIYLAFYILFGKATTRASGRIILIAVAYFVIINFSSITQSRFSDNKKYYNNVVPISSSIQDPSIYSMLDYLSQWYGNSLIVLDRYDGHTFYGQSTLSPIYVMFNLFSPVKWSSEKYLEQRMSILGNQYYYKFTGLVTNMIFDFGYLLTIIIALLYRRIVILIAPINGTVTIPSLLLIASLIQVPLFAVFYSTLAGVVFSLLLWIPVYFYLNSGRTNEVQLLATNNNMRK